MLKGLFQAEVLQNIVKPRCGGLSVWGVRVKDGGHRAKFCGPELDQLHQLGSGVPYLKTFLLNLFLKGANIKYKSILFSPWLLQSPHKALNPANGNAKNIPCCSAPIWIEVIFTRELFRSSFHWPLSKHLNLDRSLRKSF